MERLLRSPYEQRRNITPIVQTSEMTCILPWCWEKPGYLQGTDDVEVSSIQKPSPTERPQMVRLVACGLFVVDQWSVHFSDIKVTGKTHKNTGHEACPSEVLIPGVLG